MKKTPLIRASGSSMESLWFLIFRFSKPSYLCLLACFFGCGTSLTGQITITSDLTWSVGSSQNGPFTDPVYEVSGCVDEAYIDAVCGTSYPSPMIEQHFADCPAMMPIWATPAPGNCIFPPSPSYWFFKEFNFDCTDLEAATITMQGDQNFDLYFNGTLIGSSGNGQWQVPYTFDVTASLLNGANEILIRSNNVGGGSCFNYAFVAFCLQIETADTPPFVMMTDVDICENTSITLQASPGAVSYSWAPHPTLSATNIPDPVASPLATTTYTVTITYPCNLTQVDDVEVTVVSPVAVAAPIAFLPCNNNGEIQLDGSGSLSGAGVSYLWTTTNGNILAGSTTLNPLVDLPGTYTLTVTSEVATGNCAETTTVEVLPTPPPVATASVLSDIDCSTSTAIISGSGSTAAGTDILYAWTTVNGNIVSGQYELLAQVSSGGAYLLTVTDISTGCTDTASVFVEENTVLPTVFAIASGTLNCLDAVVLLSGNGSSSGSNISYLWMTNGGNILSDPSFVEIHVDTPGSYLLTVSDAGNGCTNTAQVVVTADLLLPISEAGSPVGLTCGQTTAFLNGSGSSQAGNFSYTWTTLNGNILSGADSLAPLVGGPGVYFLAVTNLGNGCSATDSVTVTANGDQPTANAGPAATLTCSVLQVSLDGSASSTGSPFSYLWTTTGGLILAGANTTQPLVGAAGNYTLTVTDLTNGCSSTSDVVVEADLEVPEIDILPVPLLNCLDTTVILDASGSANGPFFTYLWETNDGNILAGANTLQATVDEVGLYSLIVSNNDNGCTATASVSVGQSVELPNVDAGPDVELPCDQTGLNLSGSTDISLGQFNAIWTTQDGNILSGDQSLSPLVDAPGTYLLTITDPITGCSAADLVSVSVEVLNGFLFETTAPNCLDLFSGTLSFTDVSGGKAPYEYSINNGVDFTDQPFFGGLAEGVYQLEVRDANGCRQMGVAYLSAPQEILFSLEPEVTLSLGDSYQLNALTTLPFSEIASINWAPDEALSCNDCLSPIASPLESTTYGLTITSKDGCSATGSISIILQKNVDIFVPNAFSPNGDGINDFLAVYTNGKAVTKVLEFRVFARWGEAVFERFDFLPNDERGGWDGRHKGQPMNPGVYVWFVVVELTDGSRLFRKGDVTLVK